MSVPNQIDELRSYACAGGPPRRTLVRALGNAADVIEQLKDANARMGTDIEEMAAEIRRLRAKLAERKDGVG